MHDKIAELSFEKTSPKEFIQCLLSSLEEDLNEIRKNADFYSSLPEDKDREVQIRRSEVLTSFLIQKTKLIELISEIEVYI